MRKPILVFLAVGSIVSQAAARMIALETEQQGTDPRASDRCFCAHRQPGRFKGQWLHAADCGGDGSNAPRIYGRARQDPRATEMAGKPMQVRKAVSPNTVKLGNVMNAVGSPEKATHQQRAAAIRELLKIANSAEHDNGVDKSTTYGVIAIVACLDGVRYSDGYWVRWQCD